MELIKYNILNNLKKIFTKDKKIVSQKLPNEILLEIFKYIDLQTLITIKYTCKYIYYEIYNMINNNEIFYNIKFKVLDIFINKEFYFNIFKNIEGFNIEYKEDIEDRNVENINEDTYSYKYIINYKEYLKINSVLYNVNLDISIHKYKDPYEEESNEVNFYIHIYRIEKKKTIYEKMKYNYVIHNIMLSSHYYNDFNIIFNELFKLYLLFIFILNDKTFFEMYNINKNIKLSNKNLEISFSNYYLVNDNNSVNMKDGKIYNREYFEEICNKFKLIFG